MKIIFCNPKLTMKTIDKANVFFESCREILDTYIANKLYITSAFQVDQLLADNADIDDIFVFFNAEDGKYEDKFLRLLKKYNDVQSRIWAIAMEKIRNVGDLRSQYPINRVLMCHVETKIEIQ